MPYLRALSSFRDSVRKAAIGKDEMALKDILALCDKLRDEDLVPLGVALDDQEGTRCQGFRPHSHDCRDRWKGSREARGPVGADPSP